LPVSGGASARSDAKHAFAATPVRGGRDAHRERSCRRRLELRAVPLLGEDRRQAPAAVRSPTECLRAARRRHHEPRPHPRPGRDRGRRGNAPRLRPRAGRGRRRSPPPRSRAVGAPAAVPSGRCGEGVLGIPAAGRALCGCSCPRRGLRSSRIRQGREVQRSGGTPRGSCPWRSARLAVRGDGGRSGTTGPGRLLRGSRRRHGRRRGASPTNTCSP